MDVILKSNEKFYIPCKLQNLENIKELILETFVQEIKNALKFMTFIKKLSLIIIK